MIQYPNEREVMKIEKERKFLIDKFPEEILEGKQFEVIKQGYFLNEKGEEERVRQKGYNFYRTVKRPVAGKLDEREENEFMIAKEVFAELWGKTDDRRVFKVRYEVPHSVNGQKYLIEVDVYGGKLSGLITAEVEFDPKNIVAIEKFEKPEWIGEEVTGVEEYQNSDLAKNGLPNRFAKMNGELFDLQTVVNQEIDGIYSSGVFRTGETEKVRKAGGDIDTNLTY